MPLPEVGRRFSEDFRVRLGDTLPDGTLRLDGLARFLQDVATDDWADTGIVSDDVWVVRRTSIRLALGGRWPRYLEDIRLVTWCGGTGAAWAERRTNVYAGDQLLVEAEAIWVPINPQGQPVRVRPEFFTVYGEAMQGRKVSGRIATPPLDDGATSRPWPLRVSDFDVVGHVNNAALWEAVSEVAPASATGVTVIHHGSVEREDELALVGSSLTWWLTAGDAVRVSVQFA